MAVAQLLETPTNACARGMMRRMPSRREFLASGALAGAVSAAPASKDRISLAAWSINRGFFETRRWKNLDLPRICREQFSIGALEFVNQFFENPMQGYLNQLKRAGRDYNVQGHLRYGRLGAADGTHPRYDPAKLIQICLDAGFHGAWGIESSYWRTPRGTTEKLTPDDLWTREAKGVQLTRELIE